ncbi:MAG TPA: exopolysaccharide biosynthesis polyprenyl glycosylphosphotransferase [Nitrospira sp.]
MENILVLGQSHLATAVTEEMRKRRRYRILDLMEPGEPGRVFKDGVPFVGSLDRGLRTIPRTHRIVVALSERRGRLPIDALLDAKRQGVVIEDAVHLYERLTGKLALEQLQPSHLIFAPELGRRTLHTVLLRLLSVLLAVVGLMVCAPLFALIALLIKWDSAGPVFFVHERIGKGGRKFSLIKFRTMDTAVSSRSEWVRDNCDRITPVGRWLRKYRLDELPQLFNVLMGHMNVIGPRPHPASNYHLFMRNIPFYAFRAMVRPGITGWAQVRYGYANDLQEEIEKMRYDMYYIKYHSFRLDIEIIMRTVAVVVLGSESPRAGSLPKDESRFDEQSAA